VSGKIKVVRYGTPTSPADATVLRRPAHCVSPGFSSSPGLCANLCEIRSVIRSAIWLGASNGFADSSSLYRCCRCRRKTCRCRSTRAPIPQCRWACRATPEPRRVSGSILRNSLSSASHGGSPSIGDAGDEAVRARACGNRLRWPTPLPDLRGIAFRRRSLVEFGAGARRKPAPAVRAQSHALRCPTQSIPSTHAIPGAPPSGAGMVASTRPVIGWAAGSIPQMLIERCAR
jgi:hypothetical protein